MSLAMFIKFQGEVQGEKELEARVKAFEFSYYRRFGRLALSIRSSGHLAWTTHNSNPNHLHVLARRT